MDKKMKGLRGYTACPACDKIYLQSQLKRGQLALCSRCGTRLKGRCFYGPEFPLALCISAMAAWPLALCLPFISINVGGQTKTISISSSVFILFENKLPLLGIFLSFLLILTPLISMLSFSYLLFFAGKRKKAPFYRSLFKIFSHARFWDMTDVYLLSIFVVLVKTSQMADLWLLYGFWAFLVQVIALKLATSIMPVRDLWDRLNIEKNLIIDPFAGYKDSLSCLHCGLLNKQREKLCVRCKNRLYHRKPHSLNYTLALSLTALVLYFPANIYPIMIVESFGKKIPSTIIGGIFMLWQQKAFFIATIVFFASVFIPLAKLIVLFYLICSTYFKNPSNPKRQTKIYQITEWVGKWSMVDVFVVASLAAMVQMGSISTISPGVAASAFAATVIATLYAAESFDPRLLWDKEKKRRR